MKVVHIAPTPFFSNRGCHIRIRNEIEGLQQNGIEVILCTYHHGNDLPGMDVRRIWAVPGYTKTSAGYSPFKFIADFFLLFLVGKTVLQERPSLLHGHLHEGGLLGWLVRVSLFWRHIPVIMDVQGSLSGELKAYGAFSSFPPALRLFRWIEQLICRLPGWIVCSSRDSLAFLQQECGVAEARSSLLQDVVPEAFFQVRDQGSWKKTHEIPEDKRIVIYTGSFLQGKGIEYLLESMQLLLSRRQDLFFVCLGYPEAPVAQFVDEHGMNDSCRVVGEVPYDELAGWLAVADVAVDPKMGGSGEASGKVLHYMASGLPVVCFDGANNRRFLGDNAFYAEPGSVAGLAAAIEAACTEQGLADKRAREGRKRVREEYSLAGAGRKLAALYDKVLQ